MLFLVSGQSKSLHPQPTIRDARNNSIKSSWHAITHHHIANIHKQ